MPKTVEESLLGDHSDQWMESDCPEPKRLKVSLTPSTHLFVFLVQFTLNPNKVNPLPVFKPAMNNKTVFSPSVSSG